MFETLVALGIDETTLPDSDQTGTRKIRCPSPAHPDRFKSCSVNYAEPNFDGRGKGWLNCHACGLRGNSIDVIMTIRQCLGREAYEWAEQNIPDYVNARPGLTKPRYVPKPQYVSSFADPEERAEYLVKLAEWSRATGKPMEDDED
jgi:hypothetical protein